MFGDDLVIMTVVINAALFSMLTMLSHGNVKPHRLNRFSVFMRETDDYMSPESVNHPISEAKELLASTSAYNIAQSDLAIAFANVHIV